jgi:hypothetical protein
MQNVSNETNSLSTELIILEALVNEQNKNSDEYIIPLSAIRHIRDYVEAAEAILILFDHENRDWQKKNSLGQGRCGKWKAAFLLRRFSYVQPSPMRSLSLTILLNRHLIPLLTRQRRL